ncbi:MAG: hypothetical protein EAX96_17030 [Candidatus Lokiarchaeota archaeon]|nr:hypothetical protein [Candidatus Lokiarchaeota archaeon]
MNFDDNLLEEASILLEKESMLIKLDDISNSIIIGDTHGDYISSEYLINKYINDNKIKYIIFLGDYVDRGPQQLENIDFLLKMKIQFPNKLILLRGNHEFLEANQNYGFYYEILKNFDKTVYEKYLELFSKISIAFTASRPFKALGVHGGIPVDPSRKMIYTLNDINNISKNQTTFNPEDLITQIIWNDPKENISYAKASWRGAGYFFGKVAFKKFMEHNNLEFCFRSHEAFHDMRTFFNDKLYSIFTCRFYGMDPNFLFIKSNGTIEPKSIN